VSHRLVGQRESVLTTESRREPSNSATPTRGACLSSPIVSPH